MKTRGRLIAIVLIAIPLAACDKACMTAERMADQTVFNADKHVWTYEEFHRKHSAYEQYTLQESEVRTELSELEKKGVGPGNQRYDNLATELDGVRNMKRRIATEYNKMSEIAYQKVWKSKGLPDRLE